MLNKLEPLIQKLKEKTPFLHIPGVWETWGAQEYFIAAKKAYRQGKASTGIALLTTAIAHEPDNAELHYTQGVIFESLGKAKEAQKAYQTALTHHPEDPDTLYNLGRLFYLQNDFDTALAYLDLAEGFASPPDEMLLSLMAMIYEQQNNPELAIAYYEKSLAIAPNQEDIGHYLGKLYLKTNQFDLAVSLLRNVATRNPKNAELQYDYALALSKIDAWRESGEYAALAIALNPQFTKAYNQLGLSYYCTERYEEASSAYKKALELDPRYETAHVNLAYCYEKLKNYTEAITLFKSYMSRLDPAGKECQELEKHVQHLVKRMEASLPEDP
jgi:Flp pilus assembly protein TadD